MKKLLKKVMVLAMCAIMIVSQPVLAQAGTVPGSGEKIVQVNVDGAQVMVTFRAVSKTTGSLQLYVLSINNVALKEIDMNVDYGIVVHSRGSYTSTRGSERLVGEDLKSLTIIKKPTDEYPALDPYHQGFCYEKECIATVTLTGQYGTTKTVTISITLPDAW